jgi:RND family efflux transporter MFP subunit
MEMHSSKLHSSKCQGLLVIFSAALVWPLSGCSHSAVSEGTATVPVVPAARVVRTDLRNSITLTAEFQPFYEVDVMAKEAGYIKHMLVDIGDRVKEGQLLAVLEIPELQADLTKAKSDVQTANAERAVAKGDLQRAQAASQIAQLSYTRIQDVSRKEPGLVPLQEVDVAHSHNLEADAQVSAALQRVQAAESRYQSAVASLAHETALVEYTRIVAPFSGIVTQRYASDGAMIQAGIASQTQAMPVVKVSQNNPLRLMLPVPEEDVAAIHNGQHVSVDVPALHRTFDGTITRFADRVQMSTRTMTAEVDVKNTQLTLIPGMYAEVKLGTAEAKNATAVPPEAVDGTGDSQRLFLVDAAGMVHTRKVHTGIQSPQYVQILAGVNAGDVVITGRRSDLHDGQKVQPLLPNSDAVPAPPS